MSLVSREKLGQAARGAVPGVFSMVMATGIVSGALSAVGALVAARVLLVIAGAAFVALVGVTCWRAVVIPASLRADLTSPDRAFAAYAFVAACGVLGSGLAGYPGWRMTGVVLAVAGLAAWVALTVIVPVRLSFSRQARPAITDVGGTWFLWAVGTQSLAIAAAFCHFDGVLASGPAALLALAAWSAGTVIYLAAVVLVAIRLAAVGLSTTGSRASYWVAMGAASISVLAAAKFLSIGGAPVVSAARPVVTGVAVALWVLATALIPVLAAVTAATWLRSPRRLGYQAAAWLAVFPLGMYALASMDLGTTAGLPPVHAIGTAFAWVAAVVWAATFVTLVAAPIAVLAPAPRLVRPRAAQADGAAPQRRARKYQALVTPLAGGNGSPQASASWPGTWRGVVRAADHASRVSPLLTALITTPDGAESPAGSLVTVTMVVVGPGGCLDVGDAFTLWQGTDIARGVVTRRLFV